MAAIRYDARQLAALQESAHRLSASVDLRAFADWTPNEIARPFADELAEHFAAKRAMPLALYERTDHFVHRMTGETTSKTTATVLHPSQASTPHSSIELPFEEWRDDILDLSPYNPRLQELLDAARRLAPVSLDDPNAHGVYLSMQRTVHGTPSITIHDRELHMLVDSGRNGVRRVPFTLQGPADALAAARPFLHRDGAPPDAMITRSNDLLLAIRDRNGMTTNLPLTQRIAVDSNWAGRR